MAWRQSGVTLIELMFALAVLAILVAIATPSYRDAQLSSRLNAIASSLHASVLVARSEAIKSNSTVTLCASSDGAACATSGDWDQGWIVLDAGGSVIQHEDAAPAGYKVVESSSLLTMSFQPIGLGASAAAFTVCRDDPVGNQERVVSVTATGMAHVTRTENGSCP